MPLKAAMALVALLVFGFPSVDSADCRHSVCTQRPVSTTSHARIAPASDAARAFTTEEKGSLAASPRVPIALFCRGGSSARTRAWIKLTGPGGEPVHIQVDQITSVRPDAEIPGARTQLDLASGKFQRVKENVEQVMQLISAPPGAGENDETPSAALICVGTWPTDESSSGRTWSGSGAPSRTSPADPIYAKVPTP